MTLAPSSAGKSLGPVDPSQAIKVSLSLQGRDVSELQKLITAENTPGSIYYGHYLTPESYQRSFGPDPVLVSELVSYLGSYGLTTSQTGTLLYAQGTVSQVENAFSTTLLTYHDGTSTAWAPSGEPSLPSSVAPVVSYVLGLNTFLKAETYSAIPTELSAPSHITPHGIIGVTITSALSVTSSGTTTFTPMAGLSSSYTATAALPTNGTCTPCTFNWNFGDGSPHVFNNVTTTSNTVSFTYLQALNQLSLTGIALVVNITDPQGDYGQAGNSVIPTLSPTFMQRAYSETPLFSNGYSGQGFNIGLDEMCDASFGTGTTSDYTTNVDAFANATGLPLLNVVYSGPGTTCPTTGGEAGWSLETILDMDWAHAMAPDATLNVYFGTGITDIGGGDATWANQSAGVFLASNSWGLSESYFTGQGIGPGQPLPFDTTWSDAAAEGITLFSSSGDCGAVDNISSTPSYGLNVSYPASNPNGVGVGGTIVQTTNSGNWASEFVWNSTAYTGSGACPNDWGTGGGFSQLYSTPSYQSGLNGAGWSPPTKWPISSPRGVPDVAMDAATWVDIYYPGDTTAGYPAGWIPVEGTSLASPMMAATMAVVLQAMNRGYNNIPAGFLDVPFYKIGASPSEYASSFHDITQGTNADPVGYSAATGWDACTGLGSVNASALVSGLTYALPPRYAISGDVLDYTTNAGIAGATVSAGLGEPSVTTAADGSYTIELTNGTYTLTASMTGYNPNTLALVVNGAAMTGENIILASLSLGTAFTVSGIMISESGSALVGGLVAAIPTSPTSVPSASYYTTAGGYFQLYLLAGSYSLTGTFAQPPPVSGPLLNSTTVALSVAGPISGYVLTLDYSRFSLTGTVLAYATHLPIPGATIYGSDLISAYASTNAQGKFFFHMPAGPATVYVSAPGYISNSVATSVATTDLSTVTIYVVVSQAFVNQVNVNLRLVAVHNANGVPELKGQSSAVLYVWANNSTTGTYQSGLRITLSDTLGGAFSATNVMTYSTKISSVTFTAPWSSKNVMDSIVGVVYTSGWTGNHAASVLVLSDVSGCGSQCVYPVSGTVFSSLGKPITGATVTLMTSLGATVTTVTSAAGGRFSFSEGNGSYTVQATATGFSGTATQSLSIAGNAVSLVPLVLNAPSPPTARSGYSFYNAYTIVPLVLLAVVLGLTVYFLVWRLRRFGKETEGGPEVAPEALPAAPIDATAQPLPPGTSPPAVSPFQPVEQLPPSPQDKPGGTTPASPGK
jgi:subtilase family serine protease